jgi:5-methyltetrahydrofolate corrinoid/iron sulfur protein methyltransferase
MIVIGECIHIIAKRVREAIDSRDKGFIQELAKRQVEKGAHVLDLNLGPMKKAGPEVMSWVVDAVQEVVDVPLSLDTTNAAAIEAGLKLCQKKATINSTDASEERLSVLMPLAAQYNANIIALSLGKVGLPTTADARIELVAEKILPVAMEHGVPTDNLYLDPLVLTVNGNQDQAPETVSAVRFFKQMTDPAPMTICGLSNVSNSCPAEVRPILNRVYLLMMLGAGLDSAIADPLDDELMEAVRIIESRDDSTPKGELYLALHDAIALSEEFDTSAVDVTDPELRDIAKTIDVLQNKTLYAHGYLRL